MPDVSQSGMRPAVPVVRFEYPGHFTDVPSLADGEIHVWQGWLDAEDDSLSADIEGTFSAEELERCSSFKFDRTRRRWGQSRLMLRRLLGLYTGQVAGKIVISAGKLSKPRLPGFSWLQFNVSHSEEFVLLAVACDRAVGVDIEHSDPKQAQRSLARTVFSQDELEWLEQLDGDAFVQQFFRCWVRKEAYIKGTGEGLSADLQSITTTVQPAAPEHLAVCDWTVSDLEAPAGYSAAIAVQK